MSRQDDSLMRNLGKFVGAIWHGIKSDPKGQRQEIRRAIEERESEYQGQRVVIRRTTIEEVEIPDAKDV